MSVPERSGDSDVEESVVRVCPNCGTERPHEVALSLEQVAVKDRVQEENEEYARQPHRVLQCRACGETRRVQAA